MLLKPQPDTNTPTTGVDSAVPTPPSANLPAASMVVVGPLVVAAPPPSAPVNRAHYDLRNTFTGAASVESASGEAFQVGKAHTAVEPGMAAATRPLVRPCPGRIRHFKI